MLRVTVELFPHGQVSQGKILKQVFIANDGTGTPELGNYHVYSYGLCDTYIKRHKREQSVLALVGKACSKMHNEIWQS